MEKPTIPLLSPEQIAVRAGQTLPYVLLPDPARVYGDRASRLETLAEGHPIGDYLRFIAKVARAQHRLADAYPAVPVPDAEQIAAASGLLEPPLAFDAWPLSPIWLDGLRTLLADVASTLDESPARSLIEQLRAASDDHLQSQAQRVLHQISLGLNLASAPLISAGLQVYWTSLVRQTLTAHGESAFGRTREAPRCPCCGSQPTASITRIGAEHSGARYLHCSLCATQWHMVRIKCAHCESTKGIHYQALQAADAAPATSDGATAPANSRDEHAARVRAECCDECGHYLKIVHMERDPAVDPVADDLASISLDLLVTESGRQPAGVNLMLWFSEEADAA